MQLSFTRSHTDLSLCESHMNARHVDKIVSVMKRRADAAGSSACRDLGTQLRGYQGLAQQVCMHSDGHAVPRAVPAEGLQTVVDAWVLLVTFDIWRLWRHRRKLGVPYRRCGMALCATSEPCTECHFQAAQSIATSRAHVRGLKSSRVSCELLCQLRT